MMIFLSMIVFLARPGKDINWLEWHAIENLVILRTLDCCDLFDIVHVMTLFNLLNFCSITIMHP